MIITPIKPQELKTLTDLISYSYFQGISKTGIKMQYCSNNGGIVYVTEKGCEYVTPWRPETKCRKQLSSINMKICDFNFLDIQEKQIDIIDFVKEMENTYRKNLVLLRMIKLHFKK